MVKKGYLASVYAINTASGFSTAFTNEPATEIGTTKIYQITDDGKRLLDPNVGITISEGTLDTTWMDNGVDWFTGRVKLTETGKTLTVSGSYFAPPIEIGEAYNWTIDESVDITDTSSFGDEWKKKTALQKTWTGSFEKFEVDDYWFDLATTAKVFVVKFFTDEANTQGYNGLCLIPTLSITTSVAELARETVNLEGYWQLIPFAS